MEILRRRRNDCLGYCHGILIFFDLYIGSLGAQKYGGSSSGFLAPSLAVLRVLYFLVSGLIAGPFIGAVAR
jgi:uncharacterized protein YqgC (DUF456 family)